MRTTVLILLAASAWGQGTVTPTVPPVIAAVQSSALFVNLGGEYNHYSKPAMGAATVEVGVCGNHVCGTTTIEMQGNTSTLRFDTGYMLKRAGRVSFFATVGAGATLGNTPSTGGLPASSVVLGNLGGGFRARLSLAGIKIFGHALPVGFGVLAGLRIAAVAGVSVQPEPMLAMSYYAK